MLIRFVATVLLLAGHLPGLAADTKLADIRPFLQKYCFDCPGPVKQKGDYRFDTLKAALSDIETLETWQSWSSRRWFLCLFCVLLGVFFVFL